MGYSHSTAFVSVCLLAFMCAGCGGTPPTATALAGNTADISGTWEWKLLDAPGCPILDGLLSPEAIESFVVRQTGDSLHAEFDDSEGNHVVLDATATLVGDQLRIAGTFTITEAGVGSVVAGSATRIQCDGKAYLTTQPGILAGDESNLISFDLETEELNRFFFDAEPGRPCASSNGAYVFVPIPGLNNVAVIDVETDQVVATIIGDDFDEPTACVPSPDGTRLYVANRFDAFSVNSSLTIVDTSASNPILWTPIDNVVLTGFGATDICLSPDGTRAYVCLQGSADLNEVDVIGRRVTATFFGPETPISCEVARTPARLTGGAFREQLIVVGEGVTFHDLPIDPDAPRAQPLPLQGVDVVVNSSGDTAYMSRFDTAQIEGLAGRSSIVATELDLLSRTTTRDLISGANFAFGIDLCPDDDSALVALSTAGKGFFPDGVGVIDIPNFNIPEVLELFGFWVEIVGRPDTLEPRVIVIDFDGVGRFNHVDRQIDGTFSIAADNSPFANQCVGTEHEFWTFVGDGNQLR